MDVAATNLPLPVRRFSNSPPQPSTFRALYEAAIIIVVPAGTSVAGRRKPSREGGILHRDRGSRRACTVGPLFFCAHRAARGTRHLV